MGKRQGLNRRLELEKMDRPLDALLGEKKEAEEERKERIDRYMQYKVPTRKTFLLDPITIAAIKIFAFESDKGISQLIMDMFLKYIPEDIWVRARGKVIDIEETPTDYLEELEKLTIDDIYYHDYKVKK